MQVTLEKTIKTINIVIYEHDHLQVSGHHKFEAGRNDLVEQPQ